MTNQTVKYDISISNCGLSNIKNDKAFDCKVYLNYIYLIHFDFWELGILFNIIYVGGRQTILNLN